MSHVSLLFASEVITATLGGSGPREHVISYGSSVIVGWSSVCFCEEHYIRIEVHDLLRGARLACGIIVEGELTLSGIVGAAEPTHPASRDRSRMTIR